MIVDAERDDVAVAREALQAATVLCSDRFGEITLRADVRPGIVLHCGPFPPANG